MDKNTSADAQAEIARLTAERDQAITALSKSAEARGRAEGKLAASEMAGVVEGWKTRAEKAEAENEGLRDALNRIKDGYGPNHLSKFCRDISCATLQRKEG